MPTTTFPWSVALPLAVLIGLIWPIPFYFSPMLGGIVSAILGLGVALFILSGSPQGYPSLPRFLALGMLYGIVLLISSLVSIVILCMLPPLQSHDMCAQGAGLRAQALAGSFLYLISLLAVYFLAR